MPAFDDDDLGSQIYTIPPSAMPTAGAAAARLLPNITSDAAATEAPNPDGWVPVDPHGGYGDLLYICQASAQETVIESRLMRLRDASGCEATAYLHARNAPGEPYEWPTWVGWDGKPIGWFVPTHYRPATDVEIGSMMTMVMKAHGVAGVGDD